MSVSNKNVDPTKKMTTYLSTKFNQLLFAIKKAASHTRKFATQAPPDSWGVGM